MKFIVTLLIVILTAWPTWAGQEHLLLGITSNDASHAPFAVLHAAYGKMGIEAVPKYLPAKRSLVEANQGVIDGLVNRIDSIEVRHTELIRVKTPVDSFTAGVITISPNVTIETAEDMAKYKIGIRTGIQFAKVATMGMPRVTEIHEWDELFDLLAMDRLDIVLATPRTWEIQRKRPRLSKIKFTAFQDNPINLYHYLHRKHAELVPRITEILAVMEQTGESRIIRQKAKGIAPAP